MNIVAIQIYKQRNKEHRKMLVSEESYPKSTYLVNLPVS
jgi:hypothetical protein